MPEIVLKDPAKTRDSWTQDIIKEFGKMGLNKGQKTAQEVCKLLKPTSQPNKISTVLGRRISDPGVTEHQDDPVAEKYFPFWATV